MVFAGENSLNEDIIELRLNITVIMKDIEENCTDLLLRYPDLKNLPIILPTCWKVHHAYRYAKIAVTILIIHDSISTYVVSGGPFAYFLMSLTIGALSIIGVYLSQMSLILLIDFAYIAYGFVIFTIAHDKCYTLLPPERLYTRDVHRG
jgi:hypothetical protein